MPEPTKDEHFWFNLKTQRVEFGRKTAAVDRIGPFLTAEDAAKALEIVRERSKQWQQQEDEKN